MYEIAAINNLKRVNETVKSEDNILLFVKPTDLFIGVGTTKNSITKHWTGLGVLEKEGSNYYERVLSPSQFEKVKTLPHKIEKVDLLSLKNLKEVWVYNQRFSFT